MLQSIHLGSLAMAIVAAALAFRAGRAPNASVAVRRASTSTILIAGAVVIGVTPQALVPDIEWLQTAGPVSSIVLSVITLVVLRRLRTPVRAS